MDYKTLILELLDQADARQLRLVWRFLRAMMGLA